MDEKTEAERVDGCLGLTVPKPDGVSKFPGDS